MKTSAQAPASAVHPLAVFFGIAAFAGSILAVKFFKLFAMDPVFAAIVAIFLTGVVQFSFDYFWLQVDLRPSSGLSSGPRKTSWSRTFVKLYGLGGSVLFLAFLYWIFPEYAGGFYNSYWHLLRIIGPFWALFAVPYFYYVDSRQREPQDGYWHMGQVFLCNFEEVNVRILGQHTLGWLVKGFFLPLMFTYFCNDLRRFFEFDFQSLTQFSNWYSFIYDAIFLVDVGVVCVGYLLSLRLFDSHIRSTEPTLFGWVVALICYEPFWSLIGKNYLSYGSSYTWSNWLEGYPVLYVLWGSAILVLFGIYVWSSVMFGCRFSNLTHRGIITNGPYRFSKHPAYVAKNIAWWMTALPFLAPEGGLIALQKTILLLALNLVYFLRARTEERHLGQDPVYREYMDWIRQNGILRKLAAWPLWSQLHSSKT